MAGATGSGKSAAVAAPGPGGSQGRGRVSAMRRTRRASGGRLRRPGRRGSTGARRRGRCWGRTCAAAAAGRRRRYRMGWSGQRGIGDAGRLR